MSIIEEPVETADWKELMEKNPSDQNLLDKLVSDYKWKGDRGAELLIRRSS